jgi:uncharacterized lipoprotein YddW (UPF0748 family)
MSYQKFLIVCSGWLMALGLFGVGPVNAETVPVERFEFPIAVINPSSTSNQPGSGFPGYRASNQLILYSQAYGKPRTETNEFGFEVTVINGRVVEQEGSDSLIPNDRGYVLSGHGTARQWLIEHAPLGANMRLDATRQVIISEVTLETYAYQLAKKLDAYKDLVSLPLWDESQWVIRNMERLPQDVALARIQAAMKRLDNEAWRQYDVFPATVVRGAWHRPVEQSASAVGATLDRLAKAGINTVFLETFFHGYTIFPSNTYQQYGLSETQNPKFAGWDPLAVWVEECHKRGLKLHVWYQSFYVGTDSFNGPGPILKQYPQWANVQYSSMEQPNLVPSTLEKGAYFADQSNPEAAAFLLKLIEEIVTRYDIDGLQLDYMDYPLSLSPDRVSFVKSTWGYTPIARRLFQERTGVDPATLTPENTLLWEQWSAFKEEQVNRFVQQASEIVRQHKPGLKLSATAFAKLLEAKVKKHEDWRLWAEQGWIDFLAPMLLTSSVKVVGQDTAFVKGYTNHKIPIVSGLFSPFNGSGPGILMEQIRQAHSSGAHGFSVFDTAHLTDEHIAALQKAFGSASH